eukprot:scaffold238585_cov21-Tisochrysis_lutea.AAC.3
MPAPAISTHVACKQQGHSNLKCCLVILVSYALRQLLPQGVEVVPHPVREQLAERFRIEDHNTSIIDPKFEPTGFMNLQGSKLNYVVVGGGVAG